VDGRLDVDVSESRAKIALACGKCGFAFDTPEDRDQVCFLAVVAEYFGNGARVVMSLHVRFV
jgi:hypothetical protein